MKLKKPVAAAAALLALTGAAQATLHDRGGGMIYDDALNITWLQNWNQAAGSSYDTELPGSGVMVWETANTWANSLVYAGYDDWRLPRVLPVNGVSFDGNFSNNGSTDLGYAKTGVGWGTASELGHLFYVTLGNKGYSTPDDAAPGSFVEQPGWGLANTGPFTNMTASYILGFWSATEYTASDVWHFSPDAGAQYFQSKGEVAYAVAVRLGDVSAVPEPETHAMLLLGLSALAVVTRRRSR